MEKQERIERAEKTVEEMGIGNVWTPDEKSELIRIYINKGYAVIDNDGNVGIDTVKRAQFDDAKAAAEKLGYRAYR